VWCWTCAELATLIEVIDIALQGISRHSRLALQQVDATAHQIHTGIAVMHEQSQVFELFAVHRDGIDEVFGIHHIGF